MSHDWTYTPTGSCRDAPVAWANGAPPVACRDRPGAAIQAVHQLNKTLLDSGYQGTPAGWAVPSDAYVPCRDED